MIIPVKCFTCGNVLADKYRYYQAEVRRNKLLQGINDEKVIYLTKDNTEKTIEAFDYDTEEDRLAGKNPWINTGDVAIIHPDGAI